VRAKILAVVQVGLAIGAEVTEFEDPEESRLLPHGGVLSRAFGRKIRLKQGDPSKPGPRKKDIAPFPQCVDFGE
jgi:hypothetical protein